ncbi:MAG: 30S ribosomal protein S17e [Candidatus Thermoplasmatota archaeon]|nr:30S ribosomal protein S17e [Candidatus Thermoplasmatota archaeon]MCL5665273.1 30S ribosomal protein S17e [Candidatus Thermoplasmatota archaeon]
MGSIRSTTVKRIAEDLVNASGASFTKDFNSNREIVKSMISGTTKKTLNSIAGYVTRYMIKKETRRKKEAEDAGLVTEEQLN